jgi:hypothetical protein
MRTAYGISVLFSILSVPLLACSSAPPEAEDTATQESAFTIPILPTCPAGDVRSCFVTNNGVVSIQHCYCAPGFYSVYSPTRATTPPSVMLDAQGKVSLTVKNQGSNGGCWGFADVAVVESEYVAQYGLPASSFALSEQYNIFDAVRGYFGEGDTSADSGGQPTGSFEKIGHFGLPPEASYPTDPDTLQVPWNALPRVVGPVYAASHAGSFPSALSTFAQTGEADPNWMSAVGTMIAQTPLAYDLARFNGATSAPVGVHEQAAYAPTSAAWLDLGTAYPTGGANNCLDPAAAGDTTVNCANAYPYEEVLNQGHTIRVDLASTPGQWQQDPTTGVFGYKPNGGYDGHVVAIVGYDRQRQVFRFKNSWGKDWNASPNWNGNGFGEMTYYLYMKVATSEASATGIHPASFVTGVRNPGQTLGAGAWMGFWNATINGQKGVAVLHHAYPNTITVNNGATELVDVFQPAGGGAQQQLMTVSGNTTAWNIALTGTPSSPQFTVAAPFTLSRTAGAMTATYTNITTGEKETWYRCDPQNGHSYNVSPTSYAAATNDPYVLPPCVNTNWEATPARTCNGSDKLAPAGYLYTRSSPSGAVSVQSGSFCFATSPSVPGCPSGWVLGVDMGGSYYNANSPSTSPYADWDVCTLAGFTVLADPVLSKTCEASPIPVLGSSLYVDSAALQDANGTPVVVSSALLQPGPDHCLSSVYAANPFSCPAGSTMMVNGDCVIFH